jgi:hypothetical protein
VEREEEKDPEGAGAPDQAAAAPLWRRWDELRWRTAGSGGTEGEGGARSRGAHRGGGRGKGGRVGEGCASSGGSVASAGGGGSSSSNASYGSARSGSGFSLAAFHTYHDHYLPFATGG